jgi:hypothetical protein
MGATWARAWTPSVTHVIVEDNQKLEDLVKVTGQQVLPKDVARIMHTWLTESLLMSKPGIHSFRDDTGNVVHGSGTMKQMEMHKASIRRQAEGAQNA